MFVLDKASMGGTENQVALLARMHTGQGGKCFLTHHSPQLCASLSRAFTHSTGIPSSTRAWRDLLERYEVTHLFFCAGDLSTLLPACFSLQIPLILICGTTNCPLISESYWDKIIVCSEFLYTYHRLLSDPRAHVISWSVEGSSSQVKSKGELEKRFGVRQKPIKWMGYFARYSPYKAHLDCLEFLKLDEKLHLLLLGTGATPQDWAVWQEFEKQVLHLGLQERVHQLCCEAGEVGYWMENLDYYISPAREEGWGIAVAEAAVREIPVYAHPSGGHLELARRFDSITLGHFGDAKEPMQKFLHQKRRDKEVHSKPVPSDFLPDAVYRRFYDLVTPLRQGSR